MYISLEQELAELVALSDEISQLETHQDRLGETGVTVDLAMENERLTGHSVVLESYFSGRSRVEVFRIAQESIISGIVDAIAHMLSVITNIISGALDAIFGRTKSSGGGGGSGSSSAGKAAVNAAVAAVSKRGFATGKKYDSKDFSTGLDKYNYDDSHGTVYQKVLKDHLDKLSAGERNMISIATGGVKNGVDWLNIYKRFLDREVPQSSKLAIRLNELIGERDAQDKAVDVSDSSGMSTNTPIDAFHKESEAYKKTMISQLLHQMEDAHAAYARMKSDTPTLGSLSEAKVHETITKLLDVFNFTVMGPDIVKLGDEIEKIQAQIKELQAVIKKDGETAKKDAQVLSEKQSQNQAPSSVSGGKLSDHDKAEIRMAIRRSFGASLRDVLKDIATIAKLLVNVNAVQHIVFSLSNKLLKVSIDYLHELAKENKDKATISENIKTMESKMAGLKKMATECGF